MKHLNFKLIITPQLLKNTLFRKKIYLNHILPTSLTVLLFGGLAGILLTCLSPAVSDYAATVGNYAASDPVGSSEVNVSVNDNGSAVVQLPIKAPPGTRGIQPELTLLYNSVLGNGDMGLGWQIQGLSAIERTGATLAQDGFISSVTYGKTDRLLLDRQRLILVGGSSYGLTNSKYRTEIESWRNIVCSANIYAHSSASKSSFTVHAPNGVTQYYGNTDDSRIMAQGNDRPRVWALSRVEDLHGNYMTITYDNKGSTTGSYYPLKIEYTGNSKTNASTRRSIEFVWENRSDAVTTYMGGSKIVQDKRLSYIRTYVDDILIKEYHITYETSATTKRSLVKQIIEKDGNEVAYPATNFSWQTGSNEGGAERECGSKDHKIAHGGKAQWMTDVNGDGTADHIYNRGDKYEYWVMLSNEGSFGDDTNWGSKEYSVANDGNSQWMVDVNGDGMTDHLYQRGSGDSNQKKEYWVMLSTGKEFASDTLWGSRFNKDIGGNGDKQWVADMNGDGMIDHIYNKAGSYEYWVMLSTGKGFASDAFWGSRASNNIAGDGENLQWMADVNGDGMADLLYQKADVNNNSTNEYRVMLSNGNGFKDDIKWGSNKKYKVANSGFSQWFLDVNGDGLADRVYQRGEGSDDDKKQYYVGLNTGKGFKSDVLWGSRSQKSIGGSGSLQWLVDVNGDGLPDRLYNKAGTKEYYAGINTGHSFLEDILWGKRNNDVSYSGKSQWFTDIDGDGRADYLYNKNNSGKFYKISPKENAPDLLIDISNGVGGETTLYYKYLADHIVYQQGVTNDNYPVADAPGYVYNTGSQASYISDINGGSRYVVYTMTLRNNPVDNKQPYNYKYTYFYGGAKIDHHGRGWLGFAFKETFDEQMGTKQVTQFNQMFPFTGTVYSTDIYCYSSFDPKCTNNNKLHQKRTEYYCLDGPCDMDKFIHVHKESDGSMDTVYQVLKYKDTDSYYTYDDFDYAIGSTYQYDNYGNQNLKSYLGYMDAGGNDLSPGDNVYSFTDHYNNTASSNWLIGFDIQSTICSDPTGENVISKSQKHYDFPTATNSPSCIEGWQYTGTMDEICVSSWVDQDNNSGTDYWITRQKRYDPYGNLTIDIGPAGDSTVTDYETAYNTFPKQKTLPPNEQGLRMAETYTYDAGFGVKTSTTDVNGYTRSAVLDGFGRVVAKTGPNAQNPETPAEILEKISYRKANGLQYITTQSLRGWGSNAYHAINQYYDGLQRTYRKESVSDNTAKNVIVDYQFVDPKKISQESLPYFNTGTAPVYWKTREYDSYGRIIQLKEPYPNLSGDKQILTKIAYYKSDSIVTTIHDPVSNAIDVEVQVKQWYSGEQQTTKLIFPQNNSATTHYHYDPIGRIKYVKDPDGVEDTVSWNSLSAKLQFTETNMGTTTYQYYDTGQLKAVTDAKNQTQEFAYDLLNRKTGQTLKDDTGAIVKQITFVFDETPSDTSNTKGKLSSVTVQKNSITESAYVYGYSPYGHLNMEQLIFDSDNYITRMAYSPAGSKTHYIYPDNSVLRIQRGDDGNLSDMTLQNHNTSDQISTQYSHYDALGKIGQMTYGNGTTTSYQYMVDGLLDNVKLTNSNRDILMQHKFTWNYLKELQQIKDQHIDPIDYTQSFTYTNRRLTRAVGAQTYGTLNYGYSNGGNMTSFGGNNYTYNGHQIKSGPGFSAKYDDNGNMTDKSADGQTYGYEYDTQNRLAAVYKNGGQSPEETYIYDYQGRRLQKTDSGSGTVIYVSKGYEIAQQDGNTTTTKYVLGPGGHVGSMAVSTDDVEVMIRYYHHDQINSTSMVTDSQGNVISHLVYKPYGELYTTLSFGEDNVRFKYGDKELDATGLYYFNARYYDPGIGRFITADTRLGASNMFTQDVFNRYAYALNDPIDYMDPSGHSAGKAFFISAVIAGVGLVMTPINPILGAALVNAGAQGMIYAGKSMLPGNQFHLVIWGGVTGIGFVSGAISAVIAIGVTASSENPATGVAAAGLFLTLTTGLIQAGADEFADKWYDDHHKEDRRNTNSSSDSDTKTASSNLFTGNTGSSTTKERKQKAAFENEVPMPRS